MRALTIRRLAVLGVAGALLAAGCGGQPKAASSSAAGLSEQSARSGPVEVRVKPKSVDTAGAAFTIELNNHEVELNGDYAATSTLTVDGKAWTAPRWSGDGPTGHHRSGTLTFGAAGPAVGMVELRLGGLPKPVTVHWSLPRSNG